MDDLEGTVPDLKPDFPELSEARMKARVTTLRRHGTASPAMAELQRRGRVAVSKRSEMTRKERRDQEAARQRGAERGAEAARTPRPITLPRVSILHEPEVERDC